LTGASLALHVTAEKTVQHTKPAVGAKKRSAI
jgi:hypothetical protein